MVAGACGRGVDVLNSVVMITTRRGDGGETDLLFGRRVAKTDPQIEAVGACDELMAAVGLARAAGGNEHRREALTAIQRDMIQIMGAVASVPEDGQPSKKKGPELDPQRVAWMDAEIVALEEKTPKITDWVLPGANAEAAGYDFARTIARRAERSVLAVSEAGSPMAIYLNRLSDYFWLLAREAEIR